jgi:hypothetical protein
MVNTFFARMLLGREPSAQELDALEEDLPEV